MASRIASRAPGPGGPKLDRRTLVAAGVAGLGGFLLATACQRIRHQTALGPAASPQPSEDTEPAPTFYLGRPGRVVFDSVPLSEGTVMQSFGFVAGDDTAYAIQLIGDGRAIGGESAPVRGRDRARAGDLAISRLSREGRITGRMYLLGYGHGVQIGVEEEAGKHYIWCETASRDDGTNGWGTKVARLPFVDGVVASVDWSEVRTFDPDPRVDRVAVALDTAHSKIVVRLRYGRQIQFARYQKDDFLAGDFRPTEVVTDPSMGFFAQGFASYGRHLYVLEGNMDSAEPGLPPGSTYVSVVDWSTGTLVDRELITDGPGLVNREPEGMGIRQGKPGDVSTAELCIGFAGGPLGARTASIFAKPRTS